MTAPPSNRALLPTGLADVLPPVAAREAAAAERALRTLRSHGYEQTSPPMLEFEESFLSGAGEHLGRETFRMMDPASQRMLALRSDLTPQIARIAATRLANAPRPLRLCYIGAVMRVAGPRAGGERQFRQAGAELIGSSRPEADAEIVLLAAAALAAIGVAGVTVDLNVPRLAGEVAGALGLAPDALRALTHALDRKDISETRRIAPGRSADALERLIEAGGPADQAFAAAERIDLPDAAKARIARLAGIADLVRGEAPDLPLTIDFVEHRGFDYHTGVAFSLFAEGHAGELGRGGRYRSPAPEGGDPEGEPAVGFSLFMDSAGRAATAEPPPLRVYLPHGVAAEVRRSVIADGHVAVPGLEPVADAAAEAARLDCSAVWRNGGLVEIGKD